ncbi:hypothetical protein Ahu01nite_090660 [Winogradskya humida]|uniref:Uncharacterized protein n=1 Tax=Winogradskya humida TaxID=113566 RepID=A0ABQ4A559_9ACTN|nr:hypothetical protein Ahu01nite_090660 [Actinoplanes humidus]
MQALLAQVQCGGEAGDARADHQHVGGFGPTGLRGGQSTGKRRKVGEMRHEISQHRAREEFIAGAPQSAKRYWY